MDSLESAFFTLGICQTRILEFCQGFNNCKFILKITGNKSNHCNFILIIFWALNRLTPIMVNDRIAVYKG